MTDRTPTALDAIAEDYVAKLAVLSPTAATMIGIPGHDHELDDFSPVGHAARADLARETLAKIADTPDVDDVDRVTRAAMNERLGLDVELHDAGEDLGDLNNIASPLQSIRDIFDLMASRAHTGNATTRKCPRTHADTSLERHTRQYREQPNASPRTPPS